MAYILRIIDKDSSSVAVIWSGALAAELEHLRKENGSDWAWMVVTDNPTEMDCIQYSEAQKLISKLPKEYRENQESVRKAKKKEVLNG